jgi:hypothetical protein
LDVDDRYLFVAGADGVEVRSFPGQDPEALATLSPPTIARISVDLGGGVGIAVAAAVLLNAAGGRGRPFCLLSSSACLVPLSRGSSYTALGNSSSGSWRLCQIYRRAVAAPS